MNRPADRCARPSRWPVVRMKRMPSPACRTPGVPGSAKESFILSGLKRIPKFEVKFMVPFLRRALFCAVVTIPFIGVPAAVRSDASPAATSDSGAAPPNTPPASTPAPAVMPALGAPTEVAAVASGTRITVTWSAVTGATGYRVATRLKNGLTPLRWRERKANASPYTVPRWHVLSGRQHEIRVAAMDADRQSPWSDPVTTTAPALPSAPAGKADVDIPPPYAVGDVLQATLREPFRKRMPWHWLLCDPDGSGCRPLPPIPSRHHVIGSEERGKLLQARADYDEGGVWYTATVVLGIVGAAAPAPVPELAACPPYPQGHRPSRFPDPAKMPDGAWGADTTLATHLHAMQSRSVGIPWDDARGGAVEPLCYDLLVVTPWGRFALIDPGGTVAYLDGRVPMNSTAVRGHPNHSDFRFDRFRVADVLLKRRSATRWDVFITHHYFTGKCVRFRLSSTTILREGGRFTLSPSWRTVFDADPCLPFRYKGGRRAGGRMLMDGADHLLVVIGDHDDLATPQDPYSHLGKLVRIHIETGDTETLASGLRNPQGFARDEDGNLWETEHGPRGGDELNLLQPGGNYGWPVVSYGLWSRRIYWPRARAFPRHDGFARPVFAWIPSIGISSIVVNDESWFPDWKDDLLIGSLSGMGGSSGLSLFRVRRNGTDVQYVERIEVGYRIRDLAQMPDGRIALLSDDGRVHFLSRLHYAYCDELVRPGEEAYAINCNSGG